MAGSGPLTRAAQEVVAVGRASSPTHRRLRDHLTAIAVATVGVGAVCSVLTYLFEHDRHGTQVKSFGSAVFFAMTQLLTVSSSMQNPISTAGRVLDVGMEIYAITVVATLAGAVGAFLRKRGIEREQA
jgi:hypothetical protein